MLSLLFWVFVYRLRSSLAIYNVLHTTISKQIIRIFGFSDALNDFSLKLIHIVVDKMKLYDCWFTTHCHRWCCKCFFLDFLLVSLVLFLCAIIALSATVNRSRFSYFEFSFMHSSFYIFGLSVLLHVHMHMLFSRHLPFNGILFGLVFKWPPRQLFGHSIARILNVNIFASMCGHELNIALGCKYVVNVCVCICMSLCIRCACKMLCKVYDND